LRHALGLQNRDNTPHADCSECADYHKGENHGEVSGGISPNPKIGRESNRE
jgi:hypothetical protein